MPPKKKSAPKSAATKSRNDELRKSPTHTTHSPAISSAAQTPPPPSTTTKATRNSRLAAFVESQKLPKSSRRRVPSPATDSETSDSDYELEPDATSSDESFVDYAASSANIAAETKLSKLEVTLTSSGDVTRLLTFDRDDWAASAIARTKKSSPQVERGSEDRTPRRNL